VDRRLHDGLHPLITRQAAALRNPLRSEEEAYRFLGVVVVGAAVIIAAAYVNTWLGLAVAVLVFVAIGWWLAHDPAAKD